MGPVARAVDDREFRMHRDFDRLLGRRPVRFVLGSERRPQGMDADGEHRARRRVVVELALGVGHRVQLLRAQRRAMGDRIRVGPGDVGHPLRFELGDDIDRPGDSDVGAGVVGAAIAPLLEALPGGGHCRDRLAVVAMGDVLRVRPIDGARAGGGVRQCIDGALVLGGGLEMVLDGRGQRRVPASELPAGGGGLPLVALAQRPPRRPRPSHPGFPRPACHAPRRGRGSRTPAARSGRAAGRRQC